MSIEITQGESLDLDLNIVDEGGTPIDITGYTISIGAKLRNSTGGLTFDASIGSGITVTDVVNGEFNLKIIDTTGFAVGKHNLEIAYTQPNGVVNKPDTDLLIVTESIYG